MVASSTQQEQLPYRISRLALVVLLSLCCSTCSFFVEGLLVARPGQRRRVDVARISNEQRHLGNPQATSSSSSSIVLVVPQHRRTTALGLDEPNKRYGFEVRQAKRDANRQRRRDRAERRQEEDDSNNTDSSSIQTTIPILGSIRAVLSRLAGIWKRFLFCFSFKPSKTS